MLCRTGAAPMKTFILALAAVTSAITLTSGAALAGDAQYTCRISGKPPMHLNVSQHRFQMAGQTGTLNEGLFFNFTTSLGYTVVLDLGDPDRLHFQRPVSVTGTG